MPEVPIIIKTANEDNVGVVSNGNGLHAGTHLDDGTVLVQNMTAGHKVALTDIP